MLQRQMTVSGKPQRLRRLVIVLGDQLDRDHPLLQGLDPGQDLVFMAEAREEATHVRSHKARIALFLAAMRSYADELRDAGYDVQYVQLDSDDDRSYEAKLRDALEAAVLARDGADALDGYDGIVYVWAGNPVRRSLRLPVMTPKRPATL